MQILDTITVKQVIQRSEFITVLARCFNVDQAKQIVADIIEQYPDATHHCYAYLLNNHNISKSNDNGEPAGTAGMPILQALLKNDLDNVICIVIRYFGGIKLGAGGLIRAYSSSAMLAIEKATLTTFKTIHQFKLTFDYDLTGTINHIITTNKMNIMDMQYDSCCNYTVTSDLDNYEEIFIQGCSNNILIEPLQDIQQEVAITQK